jgi:L-seryl-tRNA(Ser) seleniumtransferase
MSEPSPMRALPPIHAILDHPELARVLAEVDRDSVVASVRLAVEEARAAIREGKPAADIADLAIRARALVQDTRMRLRPVINATGILLNTGLGRAPLANAAVEAISRVARGYCSLEIDLGSGGRGSRTTSVEPLLRHLTGAEAATVVNNNAAATLLALRALAAGREVVVSRGQLIEIGGNFRLPEVFEASGARLREVGTTNKTRLDDYARAIGPDTAALLRVHPSNYRIIGFTESVGIADLARLAHDRGLWAIDDVGSGVLRPGHPPGVVDEPTMAESIAWGADAVLGSGDKLLGGPQCGLIVGKASAINRINADPLMRAVRVDKMTLAALEATLRLARRGPADGGSIPLWDLLLVPVEALEGRARRIAARMIEMGFLATVEPSKSMLGGGTTPARPIPSRAVRIDRPYPGTLAGLEELALSRELREGEAPVIARVREGAVWLDLRAVFEVEDDAILTAFRRLANEAPLSHLDPARGHVESRLGRGQD